MSLARANQKQKACVALASSISDFPQAAAAIKQRAAAELKGSAAARDARRAGRPLCIPSR